MNAAVGPVLPVFVETVLPVLTIAATGFVLGRVRDVAVEPLNTVTLYVLLPALVFHSLVTTPLGGQTAARLFVAVAVFTFAMAAVATAVGRALGERGPVLSALVLASAFPNAGNFGIPVSEFAFDAVGRSTAVLFVVAQNVLIYTFGAYVASRGTGVAGRRALGRVARLPLVYVVGLAVALNGAGAVPPADGTAMETLALVGNASIPVFLLALGVQLADVDPGRAAVRTAPAVGLKLLVAPVVGVGLAAVVGFADPGVADTFVLETAAPVAITPLALLIEFGDADADRVSGPEYASTAVLLTTLGSVPVVTLVVAFLGSTGV